jgi:hypothetical protein
MKKLNLNYLVRVELKDERIDYSFKVIENDVKLFGITIRKAGVYDILNRSIKMQDYPNSFIKDGHVYVKPFVRLYFVGEHTLTTYYDTFEQAKAEYNSHKGVWINAN